MVRYVICADEIFLLHTAEERREARAAIREEGLASLPILEGEPGEDGTETGELLLAATGPSLPSDEELAETLAAIINPETTEDDRAAMVGSLTAYGRVSLRSYRSAGVLTDNAGFVLELGTRKFQVTVVS